MINYPLTVVNNFFDNPDEIREWALSLSFEKDSGGTWPGERTQPLHTISSNFFTYVNQKIFSLFYEHKEASPDTNYVTTMMFQKIDSTYNKGLVHLDRTSQLTGIIYLNKNGDFDSGTSLFKHKSINSGNYISNTEFEKRQYYVSEDKDGLDNLIDNNRDKFYETDRIGGYYNRLVLFEGNQYHAANYFNSLEEDRLTLVIFNRSIKSNIAPVARSKFITLHV